ncbi:uncharacterized protein VP01_135g8 [Puccinia sorghi]|uniref:O-methyltransferase C-terminal domain-containing protein n=1 Tax=Puccinia sorghi TaxID=27349 RepID=A0A0L6VMF6_9BASI|nr:uncharacterized protein VP01_135g8 [Puccinia sorghi]
MPVSAAQQLVALIAQAVKELEGDVGTQIPGGTITDVNSPTVAAEDQLELTATRRAALRNLQGATHQLLATLMPAGLYGLQMYSTCYYKAAIDIVLGAGIADLIHSMDPDSSKGGVSVHVLAEKASMDPRKLTHILRFLALRNIFCELSPGQWANTRHSVVLRTDAPNTLVNVLGHLRGQVTAPLLFELPKLLLDKQPDGAFSWDPQQSAFHKYYQPGCDFFQFLATSEDGHRAGRFGKAMFEMTHANVGTGPQVYKTFDWKKLGPKGTLVDVGGGEGAAAYDITTHLPEWEVVVQDRAEVVQQGKEASIPPYLRTDSMASTANVEFEVIDFFQDQPAHRAGAVDAYFLRHILHDWPSKSCVEILSRLRCAAKPTTSLLICETILSAPVVERDSPMLSNGGMASFGSHRGNLVMLTLFNAEERTQKEFEELFHQSGWLLQSVTPLATLSDYSILQALPDPSWMPHH